LEMQNAELRQARVSWEALNSTPTLRFAPVGY
jgi:hypothetical protein